MEDTTQEARRALEEYLGYHMSAKTATRNFIWAKDHPDMVLNDPNAEKWRAADQPPILHKLRETSNYSRTGTGDKTADAVLFIDTGYGEMYLWVRDTGIISGYDVLVLGDFVAVGSYYTTGMEDSMLAKNCNDDTKEPDTPKPAI